MASSSTLITYCTIAKLFEGESKLLQRGENALRSGHVASCAFDSATGVISGKVHASMRNKLYKVEVWKQVIINFYLMFSLRTASVSEIFTI